MIEKINVFISILAGIAFIILSLILRSDPITIGYRLIFVLIISFTIGSWAKLILKRRVFKTKDNTLITKDDGIEEAPQNDGEETAASGV